MGEQWYISPRQAGILIFLTITGTTFMYLPTLVTILAKEDGWFAALLAIIPGLLALLVAVQLGKRFPGMTIAGYSEAIMGKFIGKLVTFAYVLFFFQIASYVLRQFADFIKIAVLPQTPINVILFTLIIITIYSTRAGIEPIARTGEVGFLVGIMGVVLVLGLVSNEADFGNLQPFLARGIAPVLRGMLGPAAWYGEAAAILLVLIPFIRPLDRDRVWRASFMGVAGSALAFILMVVVTVAVFRVEVVEGMTFPFYGTARMISYGKFLERIEPLLLIFMIVGTSIKLPVLGFCVLQLFSEGLNIKDFRFMAVPAGFLIILISEMLAESNVDVAHFLMFTWPFQAFFFELLIPLILLGLASLLRKGVKTK